MVNIVGLVLQLFVVSRLLKYFGVRVARAGAADHRLGGLRAARLRADARGGPLGEDRRERHRLLAAEHRAERALPSDQPANRSTRPSRRSIRSSCAPATCSPRCSSIRGHHPAVVRHRSSPGSTWSWRSVWLALAVLVGRAYTRKTARAVTRTGWIRRLAPLAALRFASPRPWARNTGDTSETTTVAGSWRPLRRRRLHRFLLGSEYRELWTTPVTVPVLDLEHFAGGLTARSPAPAASRPRSLRLQAADGRQFFFRSIDKDPVQRAARRSSARPSPARWCRTRPSSALPTAPAGGRPAADGRRNAPRPSDLIVLPDDAPAG